MFVEREGLDPREEPCDEANRLSRLVIGAAIEVHRELGPGHLESSYEKALAIELELRGVPFERQFPVALTYKGEAVGESKLDFLVGGLLIVELKACDSIAPIHRAQVISYLRVTGKTLGLLINFNVPRLKEGIRRIVLTEEDEGYA